MTTRILIKDNRCEDKARPYLAFDNDGWPVNVGIEYARDWKTIEAAKQFCGNKMDYSIVEVTTVYQEKVLVDSTLAKPLVKEHKVSKFQVVVSKGDRTWDSIRDLTVQAFQRIAEFMEADSELEVKAHGMLVRNMVIKGWYPGRIAEFFQNEGYTVTIKEL